MDFNQACLNLNLNTVFSAKQLKKQYYIMSLKYHPDKHQPDKDNFYKNKFQTIKESYDFLYNYVDFDNSNINNEENQSYSKDYESLFTDFLSSIFKNTHYNVYEIIHTIISDCKNISIKQFENMDKETSIKIYEFINSYSYILGISTNTVEQIKNIINEKIKNDNIIILNPSINDLLNDNIYMLVFENKKFFIPLWHDEIYYKHNQNDLVVKCIPELPENITLDNNNNIIVHIQYQIKDLLALKHIDYNINKINYKIPISDLKIQKYQTYIKKNTGISIIQCNDIYNNENKSDIIFLIELS